MREGGKGGVPEPVSVVETKHGIILGLWNTMD
jgi:hypothetical protein